MAAGTGALYASVVEDVVGRARGVVRAEALEELESRWVRALEARRDAAEPPLEAFLPQRRKRRRLRGLAVEEGGRPAREWPQEDGLPCLAAAKAFFGVDAHVVEDACRQVFGEQAARGAGDWVELAPESPSAADPVNIADTSQVLSDIGPVPVRRPAASGGDQQQQQQQQQEDSGGAGTASGSDGGHSDSDSDYGEGEQARRAERRAQRRAMQAVTESAEFKSALRAMENDGEVEHTATPFAISKARVSCQETNVLTGWVSRLQTGEEPWQVDMHGVIARIGGKELLLPTCRLTLTLTENWQVDPPSP